MTSSQIPEDEIPKDETPKEEISKGEIPENPFPGLRSEDFRDQWAMHLVRLQIDTKVLAGEVNGLHQKIKGRAHEVAKIGLKLINTIDAQIKESANALNVSRVAMERQHAFYVVSMEKQQADFLLLLAVRQQSLEYDRRELHDAKQNWSIKKSNEKAEILADKNALAAQVREFWSLGFWGRVLVPKSLRELSKKYAGSAGS